MSIVILLGPQRLRVLLPDAIDRLGPLRRVATITGGWEERELEDDELEGHFDGRTVNLELHHRLETVFAEDPELLERFHAWQDQLERRRSLYRLRLAHALDAARELLRVDDDDAELHAEQSEAISAIRSMDAHQLARVREINRGFAETVGLDARPSIRRHREEIRKAVHSAEAIALAGGHVGRLLDQMRFFDVASVIETRPVIAWSAGAMVLGERVALFHDAPPQGPGNAEVHDAGLGRYRGVVPLPHARRRLRLDDRARVALFARRFAPDLCLPMDEGAMLTLENDLITDTTGCRRLVPDGSVEELGLASGNHA